MNSCPVDRIKFNTIEVFNTVLGECVERVSPVSIVYGTTHSSYMISVQVYVPDKAIEKDAPDLTQCEVRLSYNFTCSVVGICMYCFCLPLVGNRFVLASILAIFCFTFAVCINKIKKDFDH